MANRPLSIVIVCDNASFRMGGEAAIPLRFFREFRNSGADVTLLTHDRVRAELTEGLTVEELANVVFFVDQPLQKAIFGIGRILPVRLQEIFVFGVIGALTEWRQVRYLKGMVASATVDVVFQPVPISPKALSLVRLDDRPVFFGPLNGAMDLPPGFRRNSSSLSNFLIWAGRKIS